ncbi:pyrroloquinoline quinone biosynthesis protein C [Rhodovibrio sodomensis]|uniref:Pyrroloquinoline-quinone synthase n=1 Tax=Rhodovibrio sodomensis TaxID=1088 RepID=A0ABS1DH51_9PROT|nr:pyrroloquinoline-quinone synthase PqqC [Rhodovibrio sodomensis]MBK1669053.1 pyrroloquinoline quinone biosynthesis protein C [Rhodovibrio sodomensis]
MNPFPPIPDPQAEGRSYSPDELDNALRRLGEQRYHVHHPFHRLLHAGELTKGQVQAWALNRYCYQAAIPRKDAALIARTDDPELRREWRRRLVDHDGDAPGDGGLARWLKLAEGLDLDVAAVRSQELALPATRFACEAYVRFVAERSLLEAVASSLTELFSPSIISQRVSGMLANYDFVSEATLAYFNARLTQAPRDADWALDYVKQHARTPETQTAAIRALKFKCDVLWAMLDALHHAYVAPGHVPPGAFEPEAA